jgi:hypothetical protein
MGGGASTPNARRDETAITTSNRPRRRRVAVLSAWQQPRTPAPPLSRSPDDDDDRRGDDDNRESPPAPSRQRDGPRLVDDPTTHGDTNPNTSIKGRAASDRDDGDDDGIRRGRRMSSTRFDPLERRRGGASRSLSLRRSPLYKEIASCAAQQ